MEFVDEGIHAAKAGCGALDLPRDYHETSTSSTSSRSSPSSFSSTSPINLPQSSPALQNNPPVLQYSDVNNAALLAYQSVFSNLERQQLFVPYASTMGIPVTNNKRNPASADSALNPCYGEGITSNVETMPISDLAHSMANTVRHNQYAGYYPLHESLVTYTSNYQQYGAMQSAGPSLYGGSNAPVLQNSLPPFSTCTFSSLIHAPATNNNNINCVNQNFDTTNFDQELFKTPSSDTSSKTLKRKLSNPVNPNKEDSPVSLGESSPPCSVCGDVGSGIHYGVWACEGCKGFFRRAVLRNPQDPGFTCFFRSECDVNRENRNKCRACRLRRCQEAGMVYGASLKDIQKKRREIVNHPKTSSVMSNRSNLQQLTESIVTAHITSFTGVSEVFTNRYAAVLSLGPDQLWPPGADLSQRGVQTVQLFAQSLPFLSNLPQELSAVLLEQNAIDIMLLRVAFRFCIERDSFLFPPGAEVSLPCLSATQIGSQATNRLAALGRSVYRLGMGSEDLAFLSALFLISSDNIGNSKLLSSHSDVLNDIRTRILSAFDWYVHQRVSIGPAQTGKMIAFLADVRAVELSVPIQTWLEPVRCIAN